MFPQKKETNELFLLSIVNKSQTFEEQKKKKNNRGLRHRNLELSALGSSMRWAEPPGLTGPLCGLRERPDPEEIQVTAGPTSRALTQRHSPTCQVPYPSPRLWGLTLCSSLNDLQTRRLGGPVGRIKWDYPCQALSLEPPAPEHF